MPDDDSRGSNSSDTTTNSESDTLEKTQLHQGMSASKNSLIVQGGQSLGSDLLEEMHPEAVKSLKVSDRW